MATHACQPILTYTTDDDGVHLWCGVHRWDLNLGFEVAPQEALARAQEHRTEETRQAIWGRSGDAP